MSTVFAARVARFTIVLGLVAACGGDDDASSGAVVTGLPAQQKLSTLSDDEIKQACHSVAKAANMVFGGEAIQRATCVTLGIQAGLTITGSQVSVDVDKCQQAVDSCVSSDSDQKTVEDNFDCDSATTENFAGCEVTVGEYENCFNLFINDAQQKFSALTCQNAENAKSSEYQDAMPDAKKIPECQSIAAKCPDAELGIPLK